MSTVIIVQFPVFILCGNTYIMQQKKTKQQIQDSDTLDTWVKVSSSFILKASYQKQQFFNKK